MDVSSDIEPIANLILRIVLNPVVLLTGLAPILFAFGRVQLLAFRAEIPMHDQRQYEWLDYVTDPKMVEYTNFVGGLYSLAGGWIALCVLEFQLALKVSILNAEAAGRLPIGQVNLIIILWLFLFVSGAAFLGVIASGTLSTTRVVQSFYEHKGRIIPPYNRLFWIRGVLVLVSLVLLYGELFWLKLT